MTKENKTHDTLDVEHAAIGVESCQEKKDNKDNSSKDNDKKDEKGEYIPAILPAQNPQRVYGIN